MFSRISDTGFKVWCSHLRNHQVVVIIQTLFYIFIYWLIIKSWWIQIWVSYCPCLEGNPRLEKKWVLNNGTGCTYSGGREKRKCLIPPEAGYRGSKVLSEKRNPRQIFANTGYLKWMWHALGNIQATLTWQHVGEWQKIKLERYYPV